MRELQPFLDEDAASVAGWVTSLDDAAAWASLIALPDAATFARWHADPDVRPYVACEDGRLVAYGEILGGP